jgi:hypothetical protein
MHGRTLVLLATLTVVLLGCPGSLENPERFVDGGAVDGGVVDGGGGVVCNLDLEADGGVFQVSCGGGGCHQVIGATPASQGLDLVSAGVKARVRAQNSTCGGKSMAAYILEKVKPTPASCMGLVMPLGRPALSAVEIKCVEDWVKLVTSDGGVP